MLSFWLFIWRGDPNALVYGFILEFFILLIEHVNSISFFPSVDQTSG